MTEQKVSKSAQTFATLVRDYVKAKQGCIWIKTQDVRHAETLILNTCEASLDDPFDCFLWVPERCEVLQNKKILLQNLFYPKDADWLSCIDEIDHSRMPYKGGDQLLTVVRWFTSQEFLQIRERVVATRLAVEEKLSTNAQSTARRNSVVVLRYPNLQNAPQLAYAMEHAINRAKGQGVQFIAVGPELHIPEDIAHLIPVIEHPLPDRDEIEGIKEKFVKYSNELKDADNTLVQNALAGLTRTEAERAIALSICRKDKEVSLLDSLWRSKKKKLSDAKGLSVISQDQRTFSDLGGFVGLKALIEKMFKSGHKLKGLFLFGPSGTGKSAFAQAIGLSMGRQVVRLDLAAIMQSYVGESEKALRSTLDICDAMQPLVLFIDEIEKFVHTGGSITDSGTSSRVTGTLLHWLQERKSEVFVVCTANNINALPVEFSRADRFDIVAFCDLPGEADREAIWKIYTKEYGIPNKRCKVYPDEWGWTGAEIKQCCAMSKLLDCSLIKAAQTVPLAAMRDVQRIHTLRSYADGQVLDSSTGNRYDYKSKYLDEKTAFVMSNVVDALFNPETKESDDEIQ